MLEKESFFKKFSIEEKYFESTGLDWDELVKIYDDYVNLVPHLEKLADRFTFKLIDTNGVHSVRRRVKKPTHLIEKIIRKGRKYADRNISVKNYKEIVTDLIGVRILHLFKDDWVHIHNEILKFWKVAETPQINVRPGDYNMELLKESMAHLNCEIIVREHGYRSVHYLIQTETESKEKLSMEMKNAVQEEEQIEYIYKLQPVRAEFRKIEEKMLKIQEKLNVLNKRLTSEWPYEIYGTLSKDEMLKTYNKIMKK